MRRACGGTAGALTRRLACLLVILSGLLARTSASAGEIIWAREQEECTGRTAGEDTGLKLFSLTKVLARSLDRVVPNISNVLLANTENLIIGASNVLIHATVDIYGIKPDRVIDIPASEAQVQRCLSYGLTAANCHNHNAVLLQSRVNSSLYLECGTGAVKPYCNWRNIRTGDIVDHVEPPHAADICPYLPTENTAMLIGNDTVFAGTFSVLKEAMISRSKPPLPMLSTMQDELWLNRPKFIGSFEHGNFVYMVMTEVAQEVASETKRISRIVRICKDDTGVHRNFRSFLKLRMLCTNGDRGVTFSFDLITSIHVGEGAPDDSTRREEMLYATFHLPPGAPKGSAVCAYKVRDIVRLFDNSSFYHKQKHNIWQERARDEGVNPCDKTRRVHDSRRFLYIKDHLMAQSIMMFERIGLASVAVHHARPYDVFFLGTDSGEVLKVTRFLDRPENVPALFSPRRFKTLVIDRRKLTNDSITKLMYVQTKVVVIASTQHNVYPMSAVECFWTRTTCQSCLRGQDPYCGWCEALARCMPRGSCKLRGDNGRTNTSDQKLLQDVERGDVRLCGPVVRLDSPYFKELIIVEGQPLNLRVHVAHAEVVQWRRGIHSDLLPLRRHAVHGFNETNRTAFLDITSVVLRDSGYYTLVVKNNISMANTSIRVTVTVRWVIEQQPQNQSVSVGETAIFHCNVRRSIEKIGIDVAWRYHQCRSPGTCAHVCTSEKMEEIRLSDRMFISSDYSLVILNTQQEDAGRYCCNVRPDHINFGSEIAHLSIVGLKMIEMPMELIVPMDPENVTLKMHCAMTCADDSFRPSLTWTHNGLQMRNVGVRRCRSVIYIHDELHTGAYTCTAEPEPAAGSYAVAKSPLSSFFYVSHDASFPERQVKVVLRCMANRASRARHTIWCPARRDRSLEKQAKSPSPEVLWIRQPSDDDSNSTDTEIHAPFTVSRAGDLRVQNCSAVPEVVVFTCVPTNRMDTALPYTVIVEKIDIST